MSFACGATWRKSSSAAALSAPPEHATTMGPASGTRNNPHARSKRSANPASTSLPLASARRALDLAPDFTFADSLSLVMKFLASPKTELNLNAVLAEIDTQRQKCQTFFLQLSDKPLQLPGMEEQLAIPARLVLGEKCSL